MGRGDEYLRGERGPEGEGAAGGIKEGFLSSSPSSAYYLVLSLPFTFSFLSCLPSPPPPNFFLPFFLAQDAFFFYS